MMEKIKNAFSQMKWWEYIYFGGTALIILVIGIVFKSGPVSILFSLLNIFTIFALGKGWVWGNIFGVVASSLYVAMSFSNRLYGEVIVSLAIGVPTYLISLFTWLRNSNKKSSVVYINKKISLKEIFVACLCIAGLSVGMYYLLDYFGTAFLMVSIFSTALSLVARYMMIRRSELNFFFYIISNAIGVVLWSCVVAENFSYITTVVTYCIQVLMNFVAFVNWIRLKKAQNQSSFEIIIKCCKM